MRLRAWTRWRWRPSKVRAVKRGAGLVCGIVVMLSLRAWCRLRALGLGGRDVLNYCFLAQNVLTFQALFVLTFVMTNEIREHVRLEIAVRNLSQTEVEALSGVRADYVSKLLRGDRGQIPEEWIKLLDALDLKLYVRPKAE